MGTSLHPCRRTAFFLLLLSLASTVRGQPHETFEHGFTLRVSVSSSLDLAESSARKHGVERSASQSVLNVTLLKGRDPAGPTVPADVEAHVAGLYRAPARIRLQEVRAEGRVSYFGSFRHEPREVLDFDVSAQARAGGPRLKLGFRKRMGPSAP